MSNKFWMRNSPQPLHVVTHRAIGDIPGCSLAPRSGTFVAISLEEARAETSARADAYAADVQAYIKGELRKEQIFRVFGRPIHGAFGEKL